jgi:hypothetical protein
MEKGLQYLIRRAQYVIPAIAGIQILAAWTRLKELSSVYGIRVENIVDLVRNLFDFVVEGADEGMLVRQDVMVFVVGDDAFPPLVIASFGGFDVAGGFFEDFNVT